MPGKAGDPEQALLVASLDRAYAVVTNPDLPEDAKKDQIDGLFRQASALCETACGSTIDTLQWVNQQAASGKIEELFGKLPEDTRKEIKIAPEDVRKYGSALSQFLRYADRAKVQRQATAGLEILRYVVSIEEKNLFRLSSKNGAEKEEAVRRLGADLKMLHRQGRALVDLVQVVQEIDKKSEKGNSEEAARRLVKDLDDLGLFFLKLAQSISNLGSLPPKITDALKSYQDDVKQMSAEDVEKIILEEFGRPAKDVFVDFDAAKPLKSGTVAQTYRAKLKTLFGVKDVIIKVQRPGLGEQLEWNRKINAIGLKAGQAYMPKEQAWIVDLLTGAINGLEDSFENELDFGIEAGNARRFSRYFALGSGIVLPKVYTGYSTKRVITMEVVAGDNLEHMLDRIGAEGGEEAALELREKIFGNLLDAFAYQLIGSGEMHGDLHPGNILATEKGDLGLIDWGNVYKTRGLLSRPVSLLYNLFTGDVKAYVKQFAGMGEFPEGRTAAMRELVAASFAKYGIEDKGVRGLARLFTKPDFSTKVFEAQKEIATAAVTKLGFKAAGTYLQFFRSAAPVASALFKIGEKIPPERVKKIMLNRALLFAPKAALRKTGSAFLGLIDLATAPARACRTFIIKARLRQLARSAAP